MPAEKRKPPQRRQKRNKRQRRRKAEDEVSAREDDIIAMGQEDHVVEGDDGGEDEKEVLVVNEEEKKGEVLVEGNEGNPAPEPDAPPRQEEEALVGLEQKEGEPGEDQGVEAVKAKPVDRGASEEMFRAEFGQMFETNMLMKQRFRSMDAPTKRMLVEVFGSMAYNCQEQQDAYRVAKNMKTLIAQTKGLKEFNTLINPHDVKEARKVSFVLAPRDDHRPAGDYNPAMNRLHEEKNMQLARLQEELRLALEDKKKHESEVREKIHRIQEANRRENQKMMDKLHAEREAKFELLRDNMPDQEEIVRLQAEIEQLREERVEVRGAELERLRKIICKAVVMIKKADAGRSKNEATINELLLIIKNSNEQTDVDFKRLKLHTKNIMQTVATEARKARDKSMRDTFQQLNRERHELIAQLQGMRAKVNEYARKEQGGGVSENNLGEAGEMMEEGEIQNWWSKILFVTDLERRPDNQGTQILEQLDLLVTDLKEKKLCLPDAMKDNIIHRVLATELFTSEVLLHTLFDTSKEGERPGAIKKDVECMLRNKSWGQIMDTVCFIWKTFPEAVPCCHQGWAEMQGNPAGGRKWSKAELSRKMEPMFLPSTSENMKRAVVKVLQWMLYIRTKIKCAREFDSVFFYLLFEELAFTGKEFEDMYAECKFKDALARVSKTCQPVDNSVTWIGISRTMEDDGTPRGGVAQVTPGGTRCYKGFTCAFLTTLSGALATSVTTEMCPRFTIASQYSTDGMAKLKTMLQAVGGVFSTTGNKIAVKNSRNYDTKGKLVWTPSVHNGRGGYTWNGNSDDVYKYVKKGECWQKEMLGAVLHEARPTLPNGRKKGLGFKKYCNSNWAKSIKVLSFAYQCGIAGMTRAFISGVPLNSAFMWMLPHAQTGHMYKNKDKSLIPEHLEKIVGGLFSTWVGPAAVCPEFSRLRWFDRVQFGIQFPQPRKIVVNIKLLYDVLLGTSTLWQGSGRPAEDIAGLDKIADSVKKLVPRGTELNKVVLFVDMHEVMEMMDPPDKVKSADLGFSWKQLWFIVSNFWRNKPVLLDSPIGITPSLHRFGVSTSSKCVRQCKWIFMMNPSDGGQYSEIGEARNAFTRCCKTFILTKDDATTVEASDIMEELTSMQNTMSTGIKKIYTMTSNIRTRYNRGDNQGNPDSGNNQGVERKEEDPGN